MAPPLARGLPWKPSFYLMTDYKNRSNKKELLDQNDIPFEEVALNMAELEFINQHLGGHSVTMAGFKKLLQNRKEISVCEIGCGGGDNLKALYKFCKKNKVTSSFTGIDINKYCVDFAKSNAPIENVNFIFSDYKKVIFKTGRPDIIFSSLFCHHFTNEELVAALHWMKDNSAIGFFINDLHRHPIPYLFIRVASHLFSKSFLVKNDAPLSVLRGFKKRELKDIFKKAGITNYTIQWKWAFRYLITVFNN